jgi:hypothetical protein
MMLVNGMVGTIASSTCCFVYLCEFLPEARHDQANLILWVLYCTTPIMMSFYFQFISQWYTWVVLFGLAGCSICFLGTLVSFETPIWLIKAGKVGEGIKVLKKINSFNGLNEEKEIDLVV